MENEEMYQGKHHAPENLTEPELFGHPKGLFYLFFAELWERFSFYGMRALLMLYMVNEIFQALANRDAVSAVIYSAYGSLVYASPVIGGKISDSYLGFRKSIMLGGLLMSVGHFVLAIENNVAFFLALALIVVGNGFFKPNISTFVGSLYRATDPRKDSGFTIFYMGINIGAAASPILCGLLATYYGWHYGFGLAGVGMLLGLFFFWNGMRKGVFMDKGLPPNPEKLKEKVMGIPLGTLIPILAVLAVPFIAFLISSYNYIGGGNTFLGEVTIVNVLFYGISLAILVYLGYEIYRASAAERGKLFVAILLTIFMTLFWGFHELSGSVITLFADRNVILPNISFGWLPFVEGNWSIGAAETNAINPIFIILLSIPVSKMWTGLDKAKLNPRTPYKFSFGLGLMAVGFYILGFSRVFADAQGYVPFIYLILMYLLISSGELFMSPVGLSKITSLSPARLVAFMMGVWFLSSAYAFQIVGFIAKQLSVENTEGRATAGLATLDVYADGFVLIAQYAMAGAVIVLILSPFMNKWMKEVH
ncbi:oligopeptide:H+ symporter [Litoribacter alkaliphilus]|uniref:Oligopeptide:H+ symporter n=1 Tax=Litoribacter ruber TaxID=702568 RepID=A0AAP2CJI1_9BACT|nr:oligopeptide:H+ symporter [Litoribacter alkaliphilus]MBS9525070.1 oligopeptide:H+ symporter [Litoribacter alkaliphilus]